jgi:DNA invertase Pin-like site-specific DNA recombinase
MSERAGRFFRVSTGAQDEASQVPDVDGWCAAHDYATSDETTYVVHGKSAFHGEHEADVRRAMADMKAGEISVLVVWKSDRIDRQEKLGALIKEAESYGGRIEFVTEPELNMLAGLGGRIMTVIKEYVNADESRTKSERIKIKHNALRASGSVVGRAPWGYEILCSVCNRAPEKPRCKDHRKLFVPTAEGRKWIPRIFQHVINGNSLRDVAAMLDTRGVSTEGGKRWNEGYIGNRLIKNPVYYGLRRNGGEIEVEDLVSVTTWQAANAALASRVRHGRSTSNHEKAMLSPVCGSCWDVPRDGCESGRSPLYRVHPDKEGGYYRCTGHGAQRKGCGVPMIPAADLEAIVFDAKAANLMPHEDLVFIPGDDASDQIAKLRERGADAMRAGDYASATAAMQEASELEAQPRVAPHWERRDTGMTEADYFASLTRDGQREYLSKHEIVAGWSDAGDLAVTITPRVLQSTSNRA